MLSLEKLCFNVIVQIFERFFFAYTVSKDANLQRNFQFLQRRYSVQFLKALYSEEKLEEKYFELLINAHLTYLKGKWLKRSKYLNSTVDIFRRLPNLRRIRFKECDDEILENVGKFCPEIIEIDVNYSNVTDNGVKYLVETKNGEVPCPKLKNIFVCNTLVTDRGLKKLIRNLPSLEKCCHPDVPNSLHSIHVENLSVSENIQFFNLVELYFFEGADDTKYVLESCLTVCPKLEELRCCISDEEDLSLFNNSHLKKLSLKFCMQDGNINMDRKMNMDNFLKLNGGKLTYLEVTDFTMSIYILSAYCPNLKHFKGIRVNFTEDNDDLILNFASLTDCGLENIEPPFNKSVCLLFSSSPKLESIVLKSCDISLEMKTYILLWCKNPCAKKITLIDTFEISREIDFLKNIILNSSSLEKMVLNSRHPFDLCLYSTILKTLRNVTKPLANKPLVFLTRRNCKNV